MDGRSGRLRIPNDLSDGLILLAGIRCSHLYYHATHEILFFCSMCVYVVCTMIDFLVPASLHTPRARYINGGHPLSPVPPPGLRPPRL